MQIHKAAEYHEGQRAPYHSETFETLLKAQSGIIPLAALKETKLEESEVTAFLAKELLFLRAVADGARMSMLGTLFDELRAALLDNMKAKFWMK